jgi:hypothetical protein
MVKAIRHGEICFIKIDKLPDGLKQSESKIIVQGSHGNSHSFNNGEFFSKKDGQFIIGYFVAKNTILLHVEHGKNGMAKLPNGTYEIRKQVEHTPNGLKPIVD